MKNYVKEYKGYKVPDGATHTIGLGNFYKVVKGDVYYFDNVDGFVLSNTDHHYLKENLEPLPKAPQEWSGEGLPPVGVECIINITEDVWGLSDQELKLNGEKVSVISNVKNKRGFDVTVFEISGGGVFCFSSKLFRPLKTQQEKDREAFVKGLVKVLNSVPNGTSLSDLHAMAEKAYGAGYTAPKAADNDKK